MSQRETMGSTQHLHTTVSPATHPIWKRLAASRFAVPLLFIAAFLPRVVGFVGSTSIWQARAKAFMEALATRDWAATLQAPHPGVTTMWLAGLGRQAGLILWSDFDTLPLAQQSAIELIPIALVISLGIVLAFYLVAQVFDRQVALVAALLIALDPYHISLSKAVHVDALVSVFSMLSALYLWAFIQDQSWHRVLLSGVFAGLGLLTKTPAIFLIPYFFLCLLVWQAGLWPRHRQASPALDTGSRLPRRLRQVGVAVLIWTLALALTYILLWPTMWTQPLVTFDVTFGGSLYYRDTPHENPTFFLGEATSTDPGPLFYPINTAIKTTAISLVGFLLSFPLLFRRRLERHQRPALVLGIAFVLFYTVQMSLGEKKFARYALPALQFITILASVAWVYWLRRWTRGRSRLLYGSLALITAIQFAVSIPRHPYYGTHYNYLLGGPKWILGSEIVAGQEKGEGLEIAADYLNHMPLSPLLVVGAQQFGGFYHYFQGKAVPLTDDKVDYVLFTRSTILRGVFAHEWQQVWDDYRTREPKFVVTFDGVPYVWVFKTGPVIEPTSLAHQVDATFGQAIRLLGYDLEPTRARPGETVILTLYWEAQEKGTGDYTVFTHLLDPSGQPRAQKDNQPQEGMYPTYLWDPDERIRDSYRLEIAPDASPGDYRFAVGMYALQTMQRLPITTQQGTALPDNQLVLDGPKILPP